MGSSLTARELSALYLQTARKESLSTSMVRNVTCVLEPTYHFTSWVEPGQFLSSRRILTQTSQKNPKKTHTQLLRTKCNEKFIPKSAYQEETKINIADKREHSFNAELAAAIAKFN